MPFDKFVDIDKIDDDRRKSVTKSLKNSRSSPTKFSILPTIPGDKLCFN
jgi:hypothetical protein